MPTPGIAERGCGGEVIFTLNCSSGLRDRWMSALVLSQPSPGSFLFTDCLLCIYKIAKVGHTTEQWRRPVMSVFLLIMSRKTFTLLSRPV